MKAADYYVVEYGCAKHCRIEIDLATHSQRVSRSRLREAADAEHARQHSGLSRPQVLPAQKAGRPRGSVASPFQT